MDRLEEVVDDGYWSHSRLQTILECGNKFYHSYVLKTPSKAGAALRFGSAVHKCLERMHKEDIWEDGQIQRLWADSWLLTATQIDWSAEDGRSLTYNNRGIKMLEKYAESHRNDEVVSLETRFKIEHQGIVLGGIIDKVKLRDGRPAVVDYKTSKYPPDPLILRADPQLTMYYIASKQLGYDTTDFAIHNLLDGKEYWTSRSDSDVDLLLEAIREGQLRIQHSMYARRIGYHCKQCPFKQACLGGL